jgi:hypothetical protein
MFCLCFYLYAIHVTGVYFGSRDVVCVLVSVLDLSLGVWVVLWLFGAQYINCFCMFCLCLSLWAFFVLFVCWWAF